MVLGWLFLVDPVFEVLPPTWLFVVAWLSISESTYAIKSSSCPSVQLCNSLPPSRFVASDMWTLAKRRAISSSGSTLACGVVLEACSTVIVDSFLVLSVIIGAVPLPSAIPLTGQEV